jgi:hypothetical protein
VTKAKDWKIGCKQNADTTAKLILAGTNNTVTRAKDGMPSCQHYENTTAKTYGGGAGMLTLVEPQQHSDKSKRWDAMPATEGHLNKAY